MSKSITISIPTEISAERVNCLLCTALDGQYGSSYYWIAHYSQEWPEPRPEWWHEIPMAGGMLKFQTCEAFDDKIDKWYTLDRDACERGLGIMATEHLNHWANFITENDDAETGDVFLQLCLFGEIVYG